MTRTYLCSSNYILKMSDYKKEEWCEVWDSLYTCFIVEKKINFYRVDKSKYKESKIIKNNYFKYLY